MHKLVLTIFTKTVVLVGYAGDSERVLLIIQLIATSCAAPWLADDGRRTTRGRFHKNVFPSFA
jgi:hypothetical protein